MALDRKIVARELLEAAKLVATRPIRIDRRIAEEAVDRLLASLRTLPPKPIGASLNFIDLVTITDVAGQMVEVDVFWRSKNKKGSFEMVLGGGAGKNNRTKQPAAIIILNGIYQPSDFIDEGVEFHYQATTVLLHELSHLADVFVKPSGPSSSRVLSEEELDLKKYYNRPTEVRAYMREIVEEVQKHLPEFLQHFPKNEAIARLVKLSATWEQIKPHLTEQNKGLVLKGVYQAAEDFLSNGNKL
jgi:hypothetical protein